MIGADSYCDFAVLDRLIAAGWGDIPQTLIAQLAHDFGPLPPLAPRLRNYDGYGDKRRWMREIRAWLASPDGRIWKSRVVRRDFRSVSAARAQQTTEPYANSTFPQNQGVSSASI